MLNAQPRSVNGNLVLFSSGLFWSRIEHSTATKLWRHGAAEASHVALNDPLTEPNVVPRVHEVLGRMSEFATRVRNFRGTPRHVRGKLVLKVAEV
jgi:hypothetical protein